MQGVLKVEVLSLHLQFSLRAKIKNNRICEHRSQILLFSSSPRPKIGAGTEVGLIALTLTPRCRVCHVCYKGLVGRAVRLNSRT